MINKIEYKDPEMHIAIRGSLQKWIGILMHGKQDKGWCTLCRLRDKRRATCDECAVDCSRGTYDAWVWHHISVHYRFPRIKNYCGIGTSEHEELHPLGIHRDCKECARLAEAHIIYLCNMAGEQHIKNGSPEATPHEELNESF